MPRAWRIIKRKFADHAFDGEGSRLYGSRWTNPGQAVSFAAESLSLAVLEVLVHLQSSTPLADYVVFNVPHEPNFLINPAHARFNELIIQGPDALSVDSRVFR